MTHHHHGHDHDHGHHHGHDTESPMSFEQKMEKLLEHWIRHNSDHAHTYEDWAARANENGMGEAAALLKEVAQMTLAINDKFRDIEKAVSSNRDSTET